MDFFKKLFKAARTINDSAATGPAPLWWSVLVAGASAYAMKEWGVPLCP